MSLDDFGNQEEVVNNFKPVTFRHKTINRFSMSTAIDGVKYDFEFKNHLLTIRTEEEAEIFVKLYEGLEPRDRVHIVKVKELVNEEAPTRESVGVRGAVGVSQINSPAAITKADDPAAAPAKSPLGANGLNLGRS